MIRPLFIALALALAACGGKSATTAAPEAPKVAAAPLTRETLETYLRNRFPVQVSSGALRLDFVDDKLAATVLEELSIMGITTTAQFAAIVPPDFDTRGFGAIAKSQDPDSNIIGLLRDLMIMKDVDLYHAKAWRDTWTSSGPQDFPAPAAYGVPEEKLWWFGGQSGGDDGVESPDDSDDALDDDGP